ICGIYPVTAQIITHPYSYQQYQRISRQIYNINSLSHTSIKPIQPDDSVSLSHLDSLTRLNTDTGRNRSWLGRKLFSEHLVEIKNKDFNVYMDFLPDLQIGKD